MAEKSRRLKPRQRKTRPLLFRGKFGGEEVIHSPPEFVEGSWTLPPPLASRLYQKSALGSPLEDGSIELIPEEILFCNWNRHVELPSENWLANELESDSGLLHRAVAFDYARSGGELLVPDKWLGQGRDAGLFYRWSRDSHPAKSPPQARVEIHRSHEAIDWYALLAKLSEHNQLKHEVLIVDDEMDVTMYQVELIEPSGDVDLGDYSELKEEIDSGIDVDFGLFIDGANNWKWESIGVSHAGGRLLSQEEIEWIISEDDNLLSELFSRGLLARPGFKFGCKWRVYDGPVSQTHAPWLMQPVQEAPPNWQGTCLSVRLAEGVNKKWVCMVSIDATLYFIQISRTIPGR